MRTYQADLLKASLEHIRTTADVQMLINMVAGLQGIYEEQYAPHAREVKGKIGADPEAFKAGKPTGDEMLASMQEWPALVQKVLAGRTYRSVEDAKKISAQWKGLGSHTAEEIAKVDGC